MDDNYTNENIDMVQNHYDEVQLKKEQERQEMIAEREEKYGTEPRSFSEIDKKHFGDQVKIAIIDQPVKVKKKPVSVQEKLELRKKIIVGLTAVLLGIASFAAIRWMAENPEKILTTHPDFNKDKKTVQEYEPEEVVEEASEHTKGGH